MQERNNEGKGRPDQQDRRNGVRSFKNRGNSIERMPPQAIEVEQAVLGAMMIDAQAIGRALEILDGNSFYHTANGVVFNAMIVLYEKNEAVDQLTLSEELRRQEQLENIGGISYLAKLASEVATSANVDHHARIALIKH